MLNHTDQTQFLEDEKIDILLDLLVCPKTGYRLKFDKKYKVFLSEKGGLVFHCESGIPDMMLENAESMESFYSDKTFDESNCVSIKEKVEL